MYSFLITFTVVNITLTLSFGLLYISFSKKSDMPHPIETVSVYGLFLPWILFAVLQLMIKFKSLIPVQIFNFYLEHLVLSVFFIQKYALRICMTCLFVFIVRFVFFRFIKTTFTSFTFSFLKKSFITKDQRFIRMPKINFDILKYISLPVLKENGFFIGLDAKTHKPLYITEKAMCRHGQIVGPTGTGKTESALKPLAFQNALLGHPTVFIDGKADIELVRTFNTIFKDEKDRHFYSLNTLEVFNPDKQDILSTSCTFNPFLQLSTPESLTDTLAMAFELESETDANYYYQTQKAFLLYLFTLFLTTKKAFNFIDIVEFINYEQSRAHVYELARAKNENDAVNDMRKFLGGLKKNYPELSGLKTIIEQLFISDVVVSKLVNSYTSDINISQSLQNNDFLLFSLSAGDRYRSNRAIAKMVISILNNLVGSKQGYKEKPFWMLILDEFGQYSSKALEPLITTARSSHTSILLSYQNSAQLSAYLGLQEIVTSNTDTKFIFQTLDDADYWACYLGTIQSSKRTDVVEDDLFVTESLQGKASLREVDEFFIDPNGLRNLNIGQSVIKHSPQTKERGMSAAVFNHALLPLENPQDFVPEHGATPGDGLNLRYIRTHTKTIAKPEKQKRTKSVKSCVVFED